MLSALASLLLLGIVPATASADVSMDTNPLPGIEVVAVAAPGRLNRPVEKPVLSASGMILIDAESGRELLAYRPDDRRPMASLTKVMTALLIIERHALSETVTVSAVSDGIRSGTIGLRTGQHFTVGALLKALLLPSANDAAYVLGAFDAHSVSAFVREMNDRALELGLKNTHFSNPAGLDGAEQYSTPRDLAWLAMAALRQETFRQIVSTRSAQIASQEGLQYSLRNTNELLHYNEDVFGLKTGTTDGAGECLIVLFTEQDHPYLLVLLGSRDRYTDSLAILQAVHRAAL